ncbi:LytTR family DNA-binding domain-containing protein [Anaerovibrio sp.]|uniref:LytR/AlgR family response regulator transcription factor n=1 Tax=Anaerovibrio sp. TaxID=1872532 RepID=UPI0025BEEC1C|nr:LytTR family DNA-binding domain-containing protein [Anaerovibrio sp.]MBR2142697.1 response regulator transcription factor [Anaerovibrio sp.]
MNIAIVDDNDLDRQAVLSVCQDYISQNYPREEEFCHYSAFSCGEELIAGLYAGKYDLIILDIYMGGITGLEAARIIREKDREVKIIFLTNSEEYTLDGYRVFATGYFIKPISEHIDEFVKTFDYIVPQIIKNSAVLSIRINDKKLEVPYGDIIYIDVRDSHSFNIHLKNQVVISYMPYSELCDALQKDERFLECHHRIIINMDYVESMEQEEFILKDSNRIPISRRKRQGVKIAYMSHIINR